MTRMKITIGYGMGSTDVYVLAPYYTGLVEKSGISKDEFYSKKYKCLWLLHGLGGTCEDWINYTQIETWAEEKGIFVICPSGGTDFYVDGVVCDKWEEIITRYVWDYLHRIFPMMSDKGEDNIVAGLSMGGYGAMYYGLRHPKKFGTIAALSGGLNIIQRYAEGENITGRMQRAFGPKEEVLGGPYDMYTQAQNLVNSDKPIPKIYIACGTEDWEYEPNMAFRDYLRSLGLEVTWDEGPGYTHEWRFWNIQIEKVLNWAIPENMITAVFHRDHADD